MRYRKVWQGLALISLLVLVVAVFTATQPGADSLRPRQMQLPNGVAVEVKPGQSDGPAITGPIISEPVYPAVRNIDVRELPQIGPTVKDRLLPEHEMPGREGAERAGNTGPVDDPVAQTIFGPAAMPAPLQNFAGLDQQNWGAGWPPDTNGDVGPVYYIQTVNTSIGIYTKTTGALAAAFTFDTFFSGTGTPCDADNQGDPIVLYDPGADRWIITDFAWSNLQSGPYYECIAVSQTNNPVTGGWYQYGFMANSNYLDDYPKLGVWPDAYYMSVNLFDCLNSTCSSATWQGVQVYALNRAALLAGQPLTSVSFNLSAGSDYGALLPSNLRGAQPPAGSPNYFISADENWSGTDDVLHLWKFHVDWTTPASSTFTGPTDLVAASFVMPAGSVPAQGGTSLDTLGDRLMMQLQYRNIGGTESLWVNHTVSSGGVTGIRWYELRTPNTTPAIYQQGTYQPDTTYRWMGSLAVDRQGNMAVGYSASSSSMYPAIRYAGRLAGDPLGQLTQGENTLIAGTGSQISYDRWGDYSALSVDPVDDCTFFFTTEYYTTTGTNWQTRIGSFKFTQCTSGPTGTLSGTVRNANNSNPINGAGIVAQNSIGTMYNATANGSGVYQIIGLPIGTYSVTASAAGYNASTVAGVIVTTGVTTTQNFSLTAAAQADLSLIKTASSATAGSTSTLGYTLTVTNNGPDAVPSTITVTDVLPAGFALGTATGAGWTCSGTTTVVCTRSGLGVSATASINLIGLAPNAIGSITNTATVAAGLYDPSLANNIATVGVTLVPQTDLAVTKTGPAAAAPSATLVYAINVSNNGPLAIGQVTQTFTNAAGITINDNAVAAPYPSIINVAGGGLVQKVTARIQGITHTYLSDVDMILVGPTGAKSWLMSDVAGGTSISNLNFTFDDAAAATLSCTTTTLTSGTYKPTDCTDTFGTDVFPAPAPTGPYTPSLAQFNGTDPAGGWSMYVRDDISGDSGKIGGWGLTLLTGFAGSIIVTDVLPAGTTYIGASGTGWSCGHASGVVTCTRAALPLGAAPGIAITVAAAATTGFITNTVVVGSNLSDSAPANNAAQFTTNLIPGGATYGVSLAPSMVNLAGLPGQVVTYTLAVTNTGNVSDTFTVLVSGNAFGATSPLSMGPLGAGASTTFDVVVTIPTGAAGGTLDTANVKVTSQGDPAKFANSTLTTSVRFGVYLPIVLRQP